LLQLAAALDVDTRFALNVDWHSGGIAETGSPPRTAQIGFVPDGADGVPRVSYTLYTNQTVYSQHHK
jgi:hypothetical protein